MAGPKTVATTKSVAGFIAKLPEPLRGDTKKIAALHAAVTKKKPELWSNGMIGYGKYHFKSDKSAQESYWPLAAFAPRKSNMTIFLMGGMGAAQKQSALLKKLGPHTASSGGCIYIKNIAKVDLAVLKKIIAAGYADTKKLHP
jgi:hypothetical protein